MGADVVVRPMRAEDRAPALDLWVASWQAAYPAIDFAARRDWMDQRFDELGRSGTHLYVAAFGGEVVGFVTIDPSAGYLDQLVVGVAAQRRGIASILLAQARQVSPRRIELQVNQDNLRAIAFYRKHGFKVAGTDVTRLSGAPTFKMRWPV